MLLKLLKYDFRSMWKTFSLVWGACLAIALVNRFTLPLDGRDSVVIGDSEILSIVTALAFFAVGATVRHIAALMTPPPHSKVPARAGSPSPRCAAPLPRSRRRSSSPPCRRR